VGWVDVFFQDAYQTQEGFFATLRMTKLGEVLMLLVWVFSNVRRQLT
jgi:hypothetical protein